MVEDMPIMVSLAIFDADEDYFLKFAYMTILLR